MEKDTKAEEAEAAWHTGHWETIPVPYDATLMLEILSWNTVHRAEAAGVEDCVDERHEMARNVVYDVENESSTLSVTLTPVVSHTHELAVVLDCGSVVVVVLAAVKHHAAPTASVNENAVSSQTSTSTGKTASMVVTLIAVVTLEIDLVLASNRATGFWQC